MLSTDPPRIRQILSAVCIAFTLNCIPIHSRALASDISSVTLLESQLLESAGSIAMDDQQALVGDDHYELVSGQWSLVSRIEPTISSATTTDLDSWDKRALSGNYAVYGNEFDDEKGFNWGAATVYENTNNTWATVQKLTDPQGGDEQRFGAAVAIDGDFIVVGARGETYAERGGKVLVFERVSGVWTLMATLYPSDATGGDWFGDAVAIQGDTIVVGGPRNSSRDFWTGAAYVFERYGSSWNEVAKLTASNAAWSDQFGDQVAIDGNRILVGAPSTDIGNSLSRGTAYAYKKSGNTWTEEAILTADTPLRYSAFGRTISIDNSRAVIGAGDKTFVFDYVDGAWVQSFELLTTTFGVGSSVAVSGDNVLASSSATAYNYRFNQNTTCMNINSDGWGSYGSGTCRISNSQIPADQSGCGDFENGWGWNATSQTRCRYPTEELVLNSCADEGIRCLNSLGNDLLPDLIDCEDADGDGWGWNGLGSCRATTNIVSNGSFDNGSANWNTYLHPDSVSVYPSGDTFQSYFSFAGSVEFTWRDAGSQWWHSQLYSDPLALESGRTYQLSFSASSGGKTGGAVGSLVVENGSDYTQYLDRQDFAIGVGNRYYYAEFYVPVSDNNARVTFNLGDNSGGSNSINLGYLVIDNVRLVATDTSQHVTSTSTESQSDQCEDGDGDGFGWNGTETCIPSADASLTTDDNNQTTAALCIDSDGDGYGWNGTETCIPTPTTASPDGNNNDCDYSDANLYGGWGWNATARQSCAPLAE